MCKRLIIAGSRTIDESTALKELDKFWKSNIEAVSLVNEVVSGTCSGADIAGEKHARKFNIVIKRFSADWSKYGLSAGPIRNKQMAEYADMLLLIWDGKSRGSLSMKNEMRALNKSVYEIIVNEENK